MLLAIGTPVAWSIAISSVLTMLVSIPVMPAFTTVAQRIGTGLDSFALLAIPLFILSGELMNKGGIANRLIAFAKTLVGALPGGLALINIISAMLMGAIAGSAMAAASDTRVMASTIVSGIRVSAMRFPDKRSATFNPDQTGRIHDSLERIDTSYRFFGRCIGTFMRHDRDWSIL